MDDNFNDKYIFCPNCGYRNEKNANFCTNCGYSFDESNETNKNINDDKYNHNNEKLDTNAKNIFNTVIDSTTSELNKWTGGKGAVRISFFHFFAQVFKPHKGNDAEDIFIVGTDKTTPSLDDVSDSDVQPWLFSRILFITILAGLLLVLLNKLNNGLDIIAASVVLVVAVPISALVLFFETNVFRNISFYKVIQMFLIGGISSLILGLFIGHFLDPLLGSSNENSIIYWFLDAGLPEESAKVLIAAYFVNKFNTKSILNGLLIGSAVGTGFAAFENIQYVYTSAIVQFHGHFSATYALTRTISSISDHTEWCAITTAGLVLAKGSKKLTFNDFINNKFLRFFILTILLHTCWDWDIPVLKNFQIPYVGLDLSNIFIAIITWITILILIHAGLREVRTLKVILEKNIDSNANK